jgi:hypothetical protein
MIRDFLHYSTPLFEPCALMLNACKLGVSPLFRHLPFASPAFSIPRPLRPLIFLLGYLGTTCRFPSRGQIYNW